MVDKNWCFHNQQYTNLKMCTTNRSWYPMIGGWVCPRVILGLLENVTNLLPIPGTELQSLRYSAHWLVTTLTTITSTNQLQQNPTYPDTSYPDCQLSELARPFRQICQEFYKTNLPWNYQLSDQLQYSLMASTTSNQAWSKGLDTGTYCK